jgi:hypothetical protein
MPILHRPTRHLPLRSCSIAFLILVKGVSKISCFGLNNHRQANKRIGFRQSKSGSVPGQRGANTRHLKGPELGQTIPVSAHSCNDHQGLSGLVRRSGLLSVHVRWSARLDIDCLGDLRRLGGLLDREMQHALVEMCVDGSVFRLERQRHRSVE